MNPTNMKQRGKVELKLGIKSSIPHIKQLMGLVTAFWKINNHNAELEYSDEAGDGIVLKQALKDELKTYFGGEISASTIDETQFFDKLDGNPLIKSSLEALVVALELIWKISAVKFTDETIPPSAERTRGGGRRYCKKIVFTKNIDLLDLQIKQNEEEVKIILFNWITGENLNINTDLENDLVKFFTIISEEAVYRIRMDADQNHDVIFQQEGIYSNFSVGDEKVNLKDYRENMGSLRILNSILNQDLNFYLKKVENDAVLREPEFLEDLVEYTKRVNSYLDITNTNTKFIFEHEENNQTQEIDEPQEPGIEQQQIEGDLPYNWIIFGAPGTGKSNHIETARAKFSRYERVTFHPAYTYAQFVGTYKPKPIYKEHGSSPRYSTSKPSKAELTTSQGGADYNDIYNIQNEPYVTYEFVPGPLLRILAEAIHDFEKGIDKDYLLIIEEINRANVASVFGDIFQLLDRKDDTGESEYKINIPEELKEYLRSNDIDTDQLYLPPNFYMWATMNTADQGVFPMDTAFKRRWDFEYIDVDKGEMKIQSYMVDIHPFGEINWNIFRKAVNKRLSGLDVKEDKQLGPFFISIADLKNPKKFERAFKSKLLMYLYEDVFKHGKKNEFFIEEARNYPDGLKLYSQKKNIFAFDLANLMNEISALTVENNAPTEQDNATDTDIETDVDTNMDVDADTERVTETVHLPADEELTLDNSETGGDELENESEEEDSDE
ncbi:AAA family ATPase [Bacillus sp. Marseille-P3661]|uniref:AAA family ATPase n=1 Tax=Bacillus sp. Marseille-P3661 TaxID=1936234 RepID=UPI000C834381|nr:AAA family ATPase [Bacillus sp. Marseille-P3661]